MCRRASVYLFRTREVCEARCTSIPTQSKLPCNVCNYYFYELEEKAKKEMETDGMPHSNQVEDLLVVTPSRHQ